MDFLFCMGWWYTKGWKFAFHQISHELTKIGETFALEILLKTLFSPWKQISAVGANQTVIQKFIDNALSRVIGFVIRLSVILIAIFWAGIITLIGLGFLVLWPLLPLMVLVLPVVFAMEANV